MIPIRDTNVRNSFPFINYLIILTNIYVFVLQLGAANPEAFTYMFGFVPARFSFLHPVSYQSIISSMWMHGGFLHIIFNMWFLHIFGDNVEDRMGHIKYFLFYVICGVAAVAAQYVIAPTSAIPLIGASGAIAGVTGAYFHFFKHSRIQALVPSFFGLWHSIELPSWFFLGYWFVLQIFSGIGSLAATQYNEGGVAFFAHIGGFVCGYAIALFFKSNKAAHDEEGYERLERLYN